LIFLDKQFLSEYVEELDACHDTPILGDIKKKVESKKRMRLERAKRAKKKYHKKNDSA
jgi:tRNA (Thr-GGU) A37 N-methylase